MSKGNMFLGYARGKVGDVVFSRNNGEQITRARNRHPANPRSNAQLAQRAVIATVGKAYSAGAFVFNHSFEGLKVGAENQQQFMSLNTQMLRLHLLDELQDPPVRYNGISIVPPNAVYPTGNPYVISRGSLQQNYWRFDYPEPAEGSTQANLRVSWPAPISRTDGGEVISETVGEYIQRVGLVAGDMYTFVFFAVDESSESLEPEQIFGFVRLRVRSDIDTSQSADDEDLSTIFEYLESANVDSTGDVFSGTIGGASSSPSMSQSPLRSFLYPSDSDFGMVSVGCIRSRESSGLRSNSEMLWASLENHPRLSSLQYIGAWQQLAQSVTEPVLLLEGGPNEAEMV